MLYLSFSYYRQILAVFSPWETSVLDFYILPFLSSTFFLGSLTANFAKLKGETRTLASQLPRIYFTLFCVQTIFHTVHRIKRVSSRITGRWRWNGWDRSELGDGNKCLRGDYVRPGLRSMNKYRCVFPLWRIRFDCRGNTQHSGQTWRRYIKHPGIIRDAASTQPALCALFSLSSLFSRYIFNASS